LEEDSRAAVGRLGRVETAVSGLQGQELDLDRALADPLEEEGEARHLGPAEDPIFEEQQALVWEQGQSIDPHPFALEEPTSKLGRESEMLEEVSEPDLQDHQSQEIQALPSGRQGRAGERLFQSPDADRWADLFQASTVVENSSAMVLGEPCLSESHCHLELALTTGELEAAAWRFVRVCTLLSMSSSKSKSRAGSSGQAFAPPKAKKHCPSKHRSWMMAPNRERLH
jgi:hypothetical protein